MKALTLLQPWATLVAIGEKKIETRSWSTSYRGPLAIHAGRGVKFLRGQDSLLSEQPFHDSLLKAMSVWAWGVTPLGCIVATCDLVDVKQIQADTVLPDDPEYSFGDYRVGRFMWMLDNVKIKKNLVEVKGLQRLWEWPA